MKQIKLCQFKANRIEIGKTYNYMIYWRRIYLGRVEIHGYAHTGRFKITKNLGAGIKSFYTLSDLRRLSHLCEACREQLIILKAACNAIHNQ